MSSFEDLMNIRKNNYHFSKLLKVKDLVPFVGAGMSSSIFPMWKDLLKGFYVLEKERPYLDSIIDEGNFEDAASYLYALDKKNFIDTIKASFDSNKIQYENISEATKKLPFVTNDIIVTTNLDTVIEYLWKKNGLYLKTITPDLSDAFNESTQQHEYCLIKLHGSVEESTKYVLTKEQYDASYGINSNEEIDFTRDFPSNLGRLMVSKTLLFLGCSLKNDRTLHVLHSIMKHFNANIQHYAFLELPSNVNEVTLTERKLNKYGISVIWFPSNEFEAINVLLEKLKKKVKSKQ